MRPWKWRCWSMQFVTMPLCGSTQHSVTRLSSVSTSTVSTSVSLSSSVEKLSMTGGKMGFIKTSVQRCIHDRTNKLFQPKPHSVTKQKIWSSPTCPCWRWNEVETECTERYKSDSLCLHCPTHSEVTKFSRNKDQK